MRTVPAVALFLHCYHVAGTALNSDTLLYFNLRDEPGKELVFPHFIKEETGLER